MAGLTSAAKSMRPRRLRKKSNFVGGVSNADLAQLHTLVSVVAHYRGQRPLPQTFCAKPVRAKMAPNVPLRSDKCRNYSSDKKRTLHRQPERLREIPIEPFSNCDSLGSNLCIAAAADDEK